MLTLPITLAVIAPLMAGYAGYLLRLAHERRTAARYLRNVLAGV